MQMVPRLELLCGKTQAGVNMIPFHSFSYDYAGNNSSPLLEIVAVKAPRITSSIPVE